MTTRRRLLRIAGGALVAAPALLRAQKAPLRRVAILWGGGQPEQLDKVRSTIAAQGFVEGRSLATDLRTLTADGSDVVASVEAVVREGAEVIVAQGPIVPPVYRAVAQRVPLVIAFSGDPVAAGMVESLRAPGRRTTGVSFLVVELVAKRMELLVDIAPKAKHVGVLLNSRHYGFEAELAATQRAAQTLKLTTTTFDARSAADFPAAFATMAKARLDGLVVFPDASMTRMAGEIAAFAIRERLPVVSGWIAIARGGALASYGPDLDEAYERVGMQVVRILRGADASAMPVEQPTRIRTAVNLRTAQALGVVLPPALLARAETV